MSKHVTMLASKKSSVTEERNTFQKDLEAQNEVLNNCAHIVSHDLKSPIKNINTLMSRILEEDENKFLPASIQNCSSVSHNILRIDNLINGILQHATVGDYMETPTNLDLRKLVQELANSSSVPSNITIKVDEFLPVISIQKYWVEQVFSNLIANAIKATEHLDYGVIAIDFIEDNLFWKFAIRGNGKVISQKYLVSIFYMFRKLENVANADGVGLSLVKKITCLYQGNIWLESEVNTGTTFYLTFKK
jgi:light-regulated signal transduction histidine kinase (bacteriophytochrome)